MDVASLGEGLLVVVVMMGFLEVNKRNRLVPSPRLESVVAMANA